jgi:hypothetical protein
MPATGLGVPPDRVRRGTTVAAVPDPYEPERSILVRVHTAEHLLNYMRTRKPKHSKISQAAYCVGMIVLALFQRVINRPRSMAWMLDTSGRVDAWTAKELAMIHGIDNGRRLVSMVEKMTREIGQRDARLLRKILGEENTFHEIAKEAGRPGDRGARHVRQRFRDALEDLAEVRAARGRRG